MENLKMWTAVQETNGTSSWIVDPAIYGSVIAEDADCPMQAITRSGNTWHCLRGDNHPGRHIALGTLGVMAAWPGEHRPTLDDLRGQNA